MQKHSDHKVVCDRRNANMTTVESCMPSFANSQPSAVDGLKCVLRLVPQCSRTVYKYDDVFEIFFVTKNSAGGSSVNLSEPS